MYYYDIIINEHNLPQLSAALDEAQQCARVRKISAGELLDAVCSIHVSLGLSRADLEGLNIFLNLKREILPYSFKGCSYSTHVVVLFERGSWRLISVCRDRSNKPAVRIAWTEKASSAILQRQVTKLADVL